MEWPLVELDRVSEVRGGATPRRERPEYWGGAVPWVTPSDLPALGSGIAEVQQTSDTITTDGLDSCSASLLPPGTVLFSSRATIGKIGIAAVPLATNQGFANLIPRPEVDARYLAWCLFFNADRIATLAGSTTFKEVTKSALKRFRIPLPPPSEQRRIVELLDQTDCVRRLRVEANAKAERILPAIFFKMFGDPATNPKGWRELPIDRLADVQGGLQLSENRKGNIDVPYLRVANVYRNRLELSEIKTLSVTQPELDRTRLTLGDVLVVEGHGNPAEIGRCAVWDGSIDPCVHQNHLIRARPDPSQVRPYFLSRFLNSAAGRQHLLRCGKTTSGLNTITVSNVKSAVIFLPPLDLQQRFEEGVTSEDTTRKLRAVASVALERLWKLLLNRAFSGSLTAQWRESHVRELLKEMEHQARALAEVM